MTVVISFQRLASTLSDGFFPSFAKTRLKAAPVNTQRIFQSEQRKSCRGVNKQLQGAAAKPKAVNSRNRLSVNMDSLWKLPRVLGPVFALQDQKKPKRARVGKVSITPGTAFHTHKCELLLEILSGEAVVVHYRYGTCMLFAPLFSPCCIGTQNWAQRGAKV